MKSNIIAFETQEKRFLRDVVALLHKLNNASLEKMQKILLIRDLESLVTEYQEFLPTEYYVLLEVLNDLILSQDDPCTQQLDIMDAFTICEFLAEPPSFELFQKMALCEIPLLYDHTGFNEELLLSIIEKLKKLNKSYSELMEHDIFNNKKSLDIMWISIAQMTTTETVQMRAIESVNLSGENLITFCTELTASCGSNEKILLAIINLLESQNVSKLKKRDAEMKASVYYTILLCNNPSENVVKEIINVIKPKKAEYFKTFYMIIKDFGKSHEIISAISERLDKDELISNVDMTSILRLRLFTNNLFPARI